MAPTFAMPVKVKQLKADAVRPELLKGLDKASKKLVKEFEKTTKTWSGDKPTFEPIITLEQGSGAGLDLALTGNAKGIKKWFWLEEGTPPHVIEPKTPGGVLAFQTGYQSKTVPGVIGSGPGGASGPTAFSRGVMHPGTEARGWSVLIKKDFKPVFRDDMQAALAAGLKKAKE